MKNPVEIGTSRLNPQSNEPEKPAVPESPKPAALPEPLTPEQIVEARGKVIDVLHTCFDPEIPVNIYELGLIYSVDVQPNGAVDIKMTLTSPGCPVAGTLPRDVEYKVNRLPQVTSTRVEVVWDPPWHKDLMSEAAKLQLGIDDF
jgi:FeS assembly SUF system protein